MDDDLKNRGPADRDRVNVNEDWEMRYWTGRFACTDEELKAAVRAVGPMRDDVEAYLKS